MKNRLISGVLLALALTAALAPAADARQDPAAAPPAEPAATEETFYALGVTIWRNLQAFDLSPEEAAIVAKALTDSAAKQAREVDLASLSPKLDALRRERATRRLESEKARSSAYAAEAATRPGAVKTDSGLIYLETQAGTGDSPAATDKVKVHYRGTLVDGTEFDSSHKRGQPAEFPLNGVIPCWTEGVQKMKPGGKATLVCPSEIAYGDRGRPSIPGGATLVFEIELIEIVK
jgi:FKBP-type peptidyl-prolyl cis-trans isomerase FkpA